MGWAHNTYGGGEVQRGFWWENLRERPRHRWEDNTKMDLQEVGWGHGLDCYDSEKGQVVSCYGCGNELLNSIKCGEFD